MNLRPTIAAKFQEVADRQNRKLLSALDDDAPLLELGLDSLCYAIIVANLEDDLGLDPFTSADEAQFPVTFGDFVRLYEDASA